MAERHGAVMRRLDALSMKLLTRSLDGTAEITTDNIFGIRLRHAGYHTEVWLTGEWHDLRVFLSFLEAMWHAPVRDEFGHIKGWFLLKHVITYGGQLPEMVVLSRSYRESSACTYGELLKVMEDAMEGLLGMLDAVQAGGAADG